MKQILVLSTKQAAQRDEPLVAALSAGAQSRHLPAKFSHAPLDDLVHVITPNGARLFNAGDDTDIADYGAVYMPRLARMPELAMAAAIYLTKKGVPYIDREAYGFGSRNKMTEAWRFWEADLPHPATAYAHRGIAMEWLVEHIDELPFSFPMVLKAVDATRGANNFLIDSVEALKRQLADHPDVQFVLQEFIPNDGDFRVLVCGDEVRLIMKRIAAEGGHTNNTSKGGKATLMPLTELPETVLRDCVRAAHILGRDFAGADVVYNKKTGSYLFFEVNRAPQVGTGSYVPEKAAELAQYLSKIAG